VEGKALLAGFFTYPTTGALGFLSCRLTPSSTNSASRVVWSPVHFLPKSPQAPKIPTTHRSAWFRHHGVGLFGQAYPAFDIISLSRRRRGGNHGFSGRRFLDALSLAATSEVFNDACTVQYTRDHRWGQPARIFSASQEPHRHEQCPSAVMKLFGVPELCRNAPPRGNVPQVRNLSATMI